MSIDESLEGRFLGPEGSSEVVKMPDIVPNTPGSLKRAKTHDHAERIVEGVPRGAIGAGVPTRNFLPQFSGPRADPMHPSTHLPSNSTPARHLPKPPLETPTATTTCGSD